MRTPNRVRAPRGGQRRTGSTGTSGASLAPAAGLASWSSSLWPMAATMRDVAALAGVSVKTVSRVVNLEPHISPETVQRVRAAIAEHAWVPNASARSLRTGRTNTVAVCVPHLQQPHYAQLAEAMVTEVYRRGMQAAVEPTRDDAGRLREILGSIGTAADGVVILGRVPPEVIEDAQRSDRTVLVQGDLVDGIDAVMADVVEATALLGRHLVVMGRRAPAALGFERFERGEEILRDALAAAGLDLIASRPACATREEGSAAALEMLAEHPGVDAIVCATDEAAAGVLHALAAADVDVPGRIAVTGFGNLDDGVFATPSLTTIDPGPANLARLALELLADRLVAVPQQPYRHVVAPVALVRRESTLGLGVA